MISSSCSSVSLLNSRSRDLTRERFNDALLLSLEKHTRPGGHPRPEVEAIPGYPVAHVPGSALPTEGIERDGPLYLVGLLPSGRLNSPVAGA